MSPLDRLQSADLRRWAVLLAMVLLVVTAGCSGLGDSGDGANGTDNDTANGDEMDGDDSTDGGDGTDGEDGTDGGDGTDDRFADLDPVDESVSASEIAENTVTALQEVDELRYSVTGNQSQVSNNQRLNASFQNNNSLDRVNQEAQFERSETTRRGTTELRGYFINQTIYRNNPQFAQQFGSAWIRQNVTDENVSSTWQQFDVVQDLTARIENATHTLEGETEYEGERAYVLSADVDEGAIEQYLFGENNSVVDYNRLTMVLWISAETNRPVKVERTTVATTTSRGRSIETTTEDEFSFEYVPVDITLPEAASDAVDPTEQQDGSEDEDTDNSR